MKAAGRPLSRLDELAQSTDYSKFADPTLLTRIPIVGPALLSSWRLVLTGGVPANR
jgi:NTE family protein